MTEAHHQHDSGHDPAEHQHAYATPYHWGMGRFFQYVNVLSVTRVAPSLRGKVVLEMGCGDGYLTAEIARSARRVHAFDLNERAIAFATMIVEATNVSFSVGRAHDLAAIAAEYLDDPVDVVATFEVIEHLSAKERATFLAAARGVLATTGGVLVLTTPNGSKRPGHTMNPHHEHEFTPAELRSTLSRAGFLDVAIQGLYRQPPWPERLEHFADTVPFRGGFRRLARAGAGHPDSCRTLVATCRVERVS